MSDTVTIRVSRMTNSALNMVVAKMKATHPGRRIKQDDAIWELIKKGDPEVAAQIEQATRQPDADER